ncbi:MAG TPA: hypothetical protein VEB22_06900 [Phycisphaerales bacterium]|nr:hypothetical protein [Phycisphaerales bacterium]
MADGQVPAHDRIRQLTDNFPMADAAKDEAIYLALRGIPTETIQAVADALEPAIPVWMWVASHVNDPRLVAEHAVEQGRYEVVQSFRKAIKLRAEKKETPD